jgi:chromosomal replication initiation ATPase DnaA
MRNEPRTMFMGRNMLPAREAARLFDAACSALGILPQQMRSRRRTALLSERRWIAMYYLRSRNARLDDIAALMDRSRATVLYGIDRLTKELHGGMADSWKRLLDRVDTAAIRSATAIEPPVGASKRGVNAPASF